MKGAKCCWAPFFTPEGLGSKTLIAALRPLSVGTDIFWPMASNICYLLEHDSVLRKMLTVTHCPYPAAIGCVELGSTNINNIIKYKVKIIIAILN